jgi:hypothetical protein
LIEREREFFFFLGIWVKWKKVPSIFLSDFDERLGASTTKEKKKTLVRKQDKN